MIAYLPTYDAGRRGAAEIDSAASRRLPHGTILQHGTLYHCDGTLYRTHDAAMASWDRWARVARALPPRRRHPHPRVVRGGRPGTRRA